jgi:aspartate aminotransferase
MVRLANAEPVRIGTSASENFLMQPEQLAAAITPATKLVILNSPSNPTGAVYPRAALEAIGQVLREHPGIVILSDEIYEHIQWMPEPYVSFAAANPELIDRTVTINGFSKCFAMTGWRLGYAAGPEMLIRAMSAIQSQSTTSASSISQAAGVAALSGDQAPVRAMCAAFKRRHDWLQPAIDGLDGVGCSPGLGAFYLFPDVSALLHARGFNDDVAFCEALLEHTGVALVPGTAFGAPGFVRISYAAPLATLEDAVGRIRRYVMS